MWKPGKLGAAKVEMWKSGKLEAANVEMWNVEM